jgi:hypothetical protein
MPYDLPPLDFTRLAAAPIQAQKARNAAAGIRNRSDPSLSGTPMGFAALYPSYPKTTGCRMG